MTVFGGEAPHNVNDHVSQKAPNLLTVIADTAATLGSNVGWYFRRASSSSSSAPSTRRRSPRTASRAPTSSATCTSTRACPSTA